MLEQEVQDYYGRELQSSADLKTNACCTVTGLPDQIRAGLKKIHPEVLTRYYGCGLTIPTCLEGLRVLDLGSGSGRDCYLLSQLVGESGYVLGIDMTDEQLAVANRHREWHREQFGFSAANVDFVKGNIQDLRGAGIGDAEFDVIVSNCVVNLAADKRAVLSEAQRVLKEGGEFYFSDVYCDRRIPPELVNDRELYGECLSGALYWNDFLNLARQVGFGDPRIVESRRLTIDNESVQRKTEGYHFYSVTHRLFKLPALEPACEDYGQAVKYLGGVDEQPTRFQLDDHHLFELGKIVPVCGNSWLMLAATRYREFFEFYGDFSTHFGIFPGCGTEIPYQDRTEAEPAGSSTSSCC
ncbi:MAG: methyltransferase domain-containing protein [Pseudomonadales bacterium]|nr:methyltransferase domain-containing protein [Pseudomonadales bacterium]